MYLICTVIIDLFVSPLLADITAVCWLMVHFNLKFDICVVINVQKLIVFGQRYVSAVFFFDILYSLFFGCVPFLFYLMFSCELKQNG